jgi:hypothetical protein
MADVTRDDQSMRVFNDGSYVTWADYLVLRQRCDLAEEQLRCATDQRAEGHRQLLEARQRCEGAERENKRQQTALDFAADAAYLDQALQERDVLAARVGELEKALELAQYKQHTCSEVDDYNDALVQERDRLTARVVALEKVLMVARATIDRDEGKDYSDHMTLKEIDIVLKKEK